MSLPARSQLSGWRAWLAPIAIVAAGAAGSVLLAAWSPLPASDPLRGVVTALPLVIALLGAAGGLALPSREPPSGGDRALATELMLFAVWIAAVFARPLLGLAGVDRALAVALVLLLGTHLARRLVAIGRSLPALDMSAAPPAAAPMLGPRLFLLALAFYTAVLPWSTSQRPPDGDEPWYLLTTHSLAQDFDTDLADDYRDSESLRFLDRAIEPQPGDPVGSSGEIYSRHAPFLPILLAPFYATAGKHGALFAMAMLTAATLAAWWPLARGIWPDRPRELLAQWSVLALLPPFLVYSHQLWVEVPAALMVTLAALSIQRLSRRQRRMDWVVLAATLLALPALKLRFGLLSASLLALAFVRLARHRRRLLVVGAVGAAVGAGFLLYNRHLFGNALRIHEWQELLLYRYPASDYVSHFVGLFFDLAFGLFAAAPIWMLLLPGVARTLRSDRALRLGQDLAIVCLPYLILVASRREWFGGWSPPFRYPLALLPLLALLAVPAWSDLRHPRARAITAMLALASLGLVVVYVAEPGLAYSFADGRNRLLDSWSARVGLDLAVLLPSSVRLRPATLWFPLAATTLLFASWPWRRSAPSAGDTPGAHRSASSRALFAGATALACALLALPALAASLTTRSIDIESPSVRKTGGHPDPDPWMFDRRRFPEAWMLPEGESAKARVRAGGDLAVLRVAARAILNHPGPLELQLGCGDRLLVRLRFDQHETWEEREAGPVPWEPGCELVARVASDYGRPEGVSNGLSIDRIELLWR